MIHWNSSWILTKVMYRIEYSLVSGLCEKSHPPPTGILCAQVTSMDERNTLLFYFTHTHSFRYKIGFNSILLTLKFKKLANFYLSIAKNTKVVKLVHIWIWLQDEVNETKCKYYKHARKFHRSMKGRVSSNLLMNSISSCMATISTNYKEHINSSGLQT